MVESLTILGQSELDALKCLICQDLVRPDAPLRLKRCGHLFCGSCLAQVQGDKKW